MHTETQDGFKHWNFIIFKSSSNPSGKKAEMILEKLCKQYLKKDYEIHIYDVDNPEVEIPDDVLALPMIIRTSPLPQKRIIGDLSEVSKAIEWFDLDRPEIYQ